MNLIECKNLSMSYEGIKAFDNLTFSVEKGDYLCVLGENGSGKSTLIKGLLGLKQSSGGTIDFSGIKKSQIGYLPQQNALQKDFPATVNEIVLSGCLNRCGFRPFYRKAEKQRAAEVIGRLGISPLMKKSFCELSGGQQQRVLIARALCATENLLLLDEPVTGLDPQVTSELYEIIDELNKKYDVTVIMISHDVGSSVRYADKILHMTGESYFFGTVSEYKQTEIYKNLIGGEANA